MKILESIRLVQFFLYEKNEIQLGQITGIFGANGGGKSALLDAVQIAMLGANARFVALNAQADESATTRSLRAYCLGQYGELLDNRVRDDATTYITLVWRDTVTNEPISTGVCLSASIERDGHEVLGRYILRGIELTLGDHLEIVNGHERPREWATFRHQLVERSRATGEDPVFNDAERYIKALLLALRGTNGAPAYDGFVRAFRFGLRMRFEKTVDRIVREDVLEARPTNIRKFKEVTESFRRLAELVAQVEAKIAEGEKIEADFARATEEARRAATWSALSDAAAAEEANERANFATGEQQKAEENLADIVEQRNAAQAKQQYAREKARRLRQLRESHSAHQDHGALQGQINRETDNATGKESELRKLLSVARHTLGEAAKSPPLIEFRESIPAVADSLEQLAARLPEVGRDDLQAGLRPAVKLAATAANLLFKERTRIEGDLRDVNALVKAAEEAQKRASEGKAPLSPDVQRLLTELRDKGVQPRPVCDLVTITDPAWQPVIESFLGRRVEALMVTGAEEATAFATYRSLTGQRTIYGAKLVMEDRQAPFRPADPRSVAELIEGNDKAAVSYLRRQFGDIVRAETDQEALAPGKRTLTRDGMLTGNGEIDRLRLVPKNELKIGTGGGQREAIQSELTELRRKASRLNEENEAVTALFNHLMRVADEATVMKFALDAWGVMYGARQAIESLTRKLADTADEEYVRLGQEEAAMEAEAKGLDPIVGDLQLKMGGAETTLANRKKAEQEAWQAWEVLAAREKISRSQPEYDQEYGARQWDTLLEKYAGKWQEFRQTCVRRHQDAQSKKNSAVSTGTAAIGAFIATHREQVSPELASDWLRAQAWITQLLDRLRSTELDQFKGDMDAAYRTSQETFRSDVAIALYSNIEWLDGTMDRLNKVLESCPAFTNGERYRFRRTVREDLKGLLAFIKNVAEHGPQDDLLGGPGEIPDEFRRLLDERSAPGASGVRSALDDYREFFEFDIEILREDPETGKNKVVGHLSKRLGPGSGGEHRAPLYVIAGAALASAYRLSSGNTDGIRLIVLDEVFNKMDIANIVASMRYLESLGLQVLMASPGENLGTLTAFMDRYHEILRDTSNNVIMIEGHSVSAETRAMFRSDLPEFNPDLVEQEITALRAQPFNSATLTT